MIGCVSGKAPLEVVVKDTAPLRLAEAWMTAAGLSPEYIGPVFVALSPKLRNHLRQVGARPGILVHYYDKPAKDGMVAVHVGYDIGEQSVPADGSIEIVELPVIKVASTIHHGGTEAIVQVYESLLSWIENSGYRRTGFSRELYHDIGDEGPRITEIQIPVAG